MTRSSNTRHALLMSMVSILLCIAMLIGSTFAWFTDTASTNVNTIQSGTLDVELLDSNDQSLEGKTMKWVKADGHTAESVLWEPGCSYNLESFKIKNNGNLALKYEVQITGILGSEKLLDAIDFTIGGKTLENFSGTLAAGNSTDLFTIKGEMKESATNEYQNLSIDGIAITVRATQNTVESDSTGTNYDADAAYPEWPLVVNVVRDGTEKTLANDAAGAAGGLTASVKIPTDAQDPNASQLSLMVSKTSKTPNIKIETGSTAKSFEIKVTGIKSDNNKAIEVTLFVGKGLDPTTIKVYHNEQEITENVSYDANTGEVKFTTTSFSPFTVVFPAAGVSGKGTMEETYYKTVAEAQAAANEGKKVEAVREVAATEGDGNEMEEGELFKCAHNGLTWTTTNTMHKKVCSYCEEVIVAEACHDYGDDSTCEICSYELTNLIGTSWNMSVKNGAPTTLINFPTGINDNDTFFITFEYDMGILSDGSRSYSQYTPKIRFDKDANSVVFGSGYYVPYRSGSWRYDVVTFNIRECTDAEKNYSEYMQSNGDKDVENSGLIKWFTSNFEPCEYKTVPAD